MGYAAYKFSVKRYDCTNGKAQHCYGCYQMTETALGDYVSSVNFDRVAAERDALQLLLNERDEQVHSREHRRHAEQQACQAAERRVKDLEWVLMAIRSKSIDTILIAQIDAALNPTAEAVSHDE